MGNRVVIRIALTALAFSGSCLGPSWLSASPLYSSDEEVDIVAWGDLDLGDAGQATEKDKGKKPRKHRHCKRPTLGTVSIILAIPSALSRSCVS